MTNSLVRNGPATASTPALSRRCSVHDTWFTSNAGDALRLIQPPIGLDVRGLSATGAGRNAVYVGAPPISAAHTAGLPYVIDGVLANRVGGSLTIVPPTELQFTSNGYRDIGGELQAILPAQPITFTSEVKTRVPGLTW